MERIGRRVGGAVVSAGNVVAIARAAGVVTDPCERLREREREVLALMADGLSNRGISDHLHLSARTVESHVSSIFQRLDLLPEPGGNRRVLAVLAHLRAEAESAYAGWEATMRHDTG